MTTYYVAKSGSNGNGGLTYATAKLTVGAGIGLLGSGDTLKIGTGTYYENFTQFDTWSPAAVITIRDNADGSVILDSSSTNGLSWSLDSGNLWKATLPNSVTAVIVNNRNTWPEFSKAAVVDDRWYYDSATTTLYLQVTEHTTPASQDTIVVPNPVSTVQGIYMNNASNFTFLNLEIRGASGYGIFPSGTLSGITVDGCLIRHNRSTGVGVVVGNNNIVQNCSITNNGLKNWPRGSFGGGWATGVQFVAPGAGNVCQYNTVWFNHGEGVSVSFPGTGSVTINNNTIYDNWSANIYLDNAPNNSVYANLIYATTRDISTPGVGDFYNNANPPDYSNFVKFLRPIGVLTGDENGPNCSGNSIYNNLILACRHGFAHNAAVAGSGIKTTTFVFNTIILSADQSAALDNRCFQLLYNSGNNSGSLFQDNLLIIRNGTTGPGQYFIVGTNDPAHVADNFKGLTIDHNLCYNPTAHTNAYQWFDDGGSGTDLSQAGWVAVAGAAHGGGDVLTDPLLVDYTTLVALDKKLTAGSPAIGAGVATSVTTDYLGTGRPNPPAIGAFEVSTGSRPPVSSRPPASSRPPVLWRPIAPSRPGI